MQKHYFPLIELLLHTLGNKGTKLTAQPRRCLMRENRNHFFTLIERVPG